MSQRWSEIPFTYHFINLRTNHSTNKIPFVVGGATQQGTTHIFDNKNNQDAISIFLCDDFMIGIVCDGCTSTHDELRNSFSNNEIGSKLISYHLSNILQKYLSTNKVLDESFLESIAESLFSRLQSFITSLREDDEKEKEIFIYDYLMTTILCFVVTEDNYIIFSCGDGVIGINDEIHSLDENGSYFSSSLLSVCCPTFYSKPIKTNKFNVNYIGKTSELENIFLATDGFNDIVAKYPLKLKSFIINSIPKAKNGYDFLLPEFRKSILNDEDISIYSTYANWPKDDASFLLLRRINVTNKLKSSENFIKGIEDDTINEQ